MLPSVSIATMALPTKTYVLSVEERDQLSNDVGLSPVTLARFLAGQLELPDASARRIEASILDLGLGTTVSPVRTVALMVPDLTASYFAHMAQCVEREALDLGWDLLIAMTGNDVGRELRLLDAFPSGNVAGVLLFTNNGTNERLLQALARRDDIVALAEAVPEGHAHRVVNDLQNVGRLAGEHLVALGHRQIAFIGGPPLVASTRQISTSFSREIYPSLAARGDYQELLGAHSEEHGFSAMTRLAARSRRPTAILAGSSVIAQGIIRACRQLELDVPGDVSLVAFDGTGPLDLLRPSVTSITVRMEDVARRGLTLLRRRSGNRTRPLTDKVEVTLEIRESTAPPRVRRRLARL